VTDQTDLNPALILRSAHRNLRIDIVCRSMTRNLIVADSLNAAGRATCVQQCDSTTYTPGIATINGQAQPSRPSTPSGGRHNGACGI
jgi:hypothetical protein